MPTPSADDTAQTYWDGFHGGLDLPDGWSPAPNPLLVREVEGRTPGSALDLGCGAGGDAIWLAGRGWRVTAVDVSGTVLRRAAGFADTAGVADRIEWRRHDLTESFPTATFDLVTAQFLHSPTERPGQRDDILRRAASVVGPGGTLLVGGHAGYPSWVDEAATGVRLPSTTEVLAALALDPRRWTLETEETLTRELRGPDGEPGGRVDNVLRLRRSR